MVDPLTEQLLLQSRRRAEPRRRGRGRAEVRKEPGTRAAVVECPPRAADARRPQRPSPAAGRVLQLLSLRRVERLPLLVRRQDAVGGRLEFGHRGNVAGRRVELIDDGLRVDFRQTKPDVRKHGDHVSLPVEILANVDSKLSS